MTAHSTPYPRRNLDFLLFGSTLILVVVGLLMVVDSSYVQELNHNKAIFHFLGKQATGAIIGLAAMLLIMRVGYWRLRAVAFPLAVVGVLLLFACFIPHIGYSENNATRWIGTKSIHLQPSEFAKLFLIIYVAKLLSLPRAKPRRGENALLLWLGPPLAIMAIYVVLIEREPDLGTAAVLFLAVMVQLFLAGVRKRHLAIILGVTAMCAILFVSVFQHRGHRIETFLHPERDPQGRGFQMTHATLAVASGEWLGMGWGRGREKYYLPEANSDFVFATMAEELGFVGVLPVIGLLVIVGVRGFMIAQRARDRFGALLAGGLTALISWQALINMGVATGSIPATGVPLPFISYGSSSLVMLLASIGVLLSISQHPAPPGQPASDR
ncbi:MAG TPA: putative lipid II flippase FtsW [Chthonomonadaceae bacterium]|nr:putative lipid II flippase FtsW [Chthonomonadaceae bacterium]